MVDVSSGHSNGAPFSRRVKSLLWVAALPGAVIGFLGDLLSALGGWLVVAVVGIIALFVGGILFLSYPSLKRIINKISLESTILSDPEFSWIWGAEKPFRSHLIHCVFTFAFVCIFLSVKSYVAREEGGILAQNLEAVKLAQEKLGIIRSIEKNQKAANEKLDALIIATKKEVSENPRKELANMGINWQEAEFDQAILRKDLIAIELFVSGGMQLSSGAFYSVLTSGDVDIAELLERKSEITSDASCLKVVHKISYEDLTKFNATQRKLFRIMCAKDVVKDNLKNEYKKALDESREYDSNYALRLTKVRPVEKCMKEEYRSNGMSLLNEAVEVNPYRKSPGFSDREYMLVQIHNTLLVFGGLGDDKLIEQKILSIVRSYCTDQSVKPIRDKSYDQRLYKFKQLSSFVS